MKTKYILYIATIFGIIILNFFLIENLKLSVSNFKEVQPKISRETGRFHVFNEMIKTHKNPNCLTLGSTLSASIGKHSNSNMLLECQIISNNQEIFIDTLLSYPVTRKDRYYISKWTSSDQIEVLIPNDTSLINEDFRRIHVNNCSGTL